MALLLSHILLSSSLKVHLHVQHVLVPTKPCRIIYRPLTPVAVCNSSLAEEAEVSDCNSSVQLLATVWPPALSLLHLSVPGYGSHQGGMLFLNTTHIIISESTLCTAAFMLLTMYRIKLCLVPTCLFQLLLAPACVPAFLKQPT